jgi:hypothetical protein
MAPPIPTPPTTKIPGTATPSPDTRRMPAQPGFTPEPSRTGQTIEVPGRPGVGTETNRDKATGPGGQRLVGNTSNRETNHNTSRDTNRNTDIDTPGAPRKGTSIDSVDANVEPFGMDSLNANPDTDLAGDTKPL